VRARAPFWDRKVRDLAKAWRVFRQDAPGGVEALSAALGSVAASARATKGERLARRARRLRRRLAELSALERNRDILKRVRRLGFLPPEAAESLDARWEELSGALARRARRHLRGRRLRRLRREISRHGRHAPERFLALLERSYRRAVRRVGGLASSAEDRDLLRQLRRRRKASQIARVLGEAGAPAAPGNIAAEDPGAAALARWRELCLFRRSLERELREAERRGAVTLALDLDGLLATLEKTLVRARREAAAAAAAGNVVAFRRRAAQARPA
jgi:hypothetical protein